MEFAAFLLSGALSVRGNLIQWKPLYFSAQLYTK